MMARVAFVALLGTAVAASADPDAILGTWATEDAEGRRDSIVEITREGEVYVGRVVWLSVAVYPDDDPKGMAGQPVVDRENPDPALRGRPIRGLRIVEGLRHDDGAWTDGRIYAPREGATYRARAHLDGPDTLRIRGYIGTPLLGRTVTWTRARVPSP